MNLIVGSLVVAGCVFGGFVLSGGQLLALWHPNEILVICGAALGAFIISNPMKLIKEVFGGIPALLKGSPYDKSLYMDLLSLLYELFSKARKDGLMSLEQDIEEPAKSPVFKRYPKILADHHALEFITDYLRLMVNGSANPMELENLMDVELETHHQEAHLKPHAVTQVSDGLPGFGIVAAVLGIVITMASITEGPEVIGAKVATALVGTFLGILLAYGFVGPMANALGHLVEAQGKFLECAKVALLASVNGYAPQVAVEFGRKAIPPSERPTFSELENHIKKKKK